MNVPLFIYYFRDKSDLGINSSVKMSRHIVQENKYGKYDQNVINII